MTIPILNIFIRFGDIRRRTSKSSEIRLNFACFSPPNFFWGVPPEILDWHYKIEPITDHRAKFHAGRPTHLGDLASEEKIIKLEIWGKVQRESARRPKSDWGKLEGEGVKFLRHQCHVA